MGYKEVAGGICAPKGFAAAGVCCGIRAGHTEKYDLALIKADVRCAAAGVYTTNKVCGAPIKVDRAHLKDGYAQAILVNSGNANTCNANGVEIAERTCGLLAEELSISENDIIIASTGVIGEPLSIEPFEKGIPELVKGLGAHNSYAAEGIMTTDTKEKSVAVSFEVDGKTCTIGGIAKGSGMIHPNMATMLVFITTDCRISADMLQRALSTDIQNTFNMVSIDGDTSTNDMVAVMANGLAENEEITGEGEGFTSFMSALNSVTVELCRMIAGDGEGATKLIECSVKNAPDEKTAKTVAKSVICSSLTKAAIFGADANWGRVLCAIGYSGAEIDVDKVDVSFASKAGVVDVCKNGAGIAFSEEKAKEVLLQDEIDILIGLNDGEACAKAWGCDLTYDYVKINGDYRT